MNKKAAGLHAGFRKKQICGFTARANLPGEDGKLVLKVIRKELSLFQHFVQEHYKSGYATGVSFLDNLENNLKALEGREEKDPAQLVREQQQKDAERAAEMERAPHVQALRTSAFTNELLTHCRVIGHGMRTLVQFDWVGEVLRLDAKQKRLELRPTKSGIDAVFLVDLQEQSREALDLTSSAEAFARRWLES